MPFKKHFCKLFEEHTWANLHCCQASLMMYKLRGEDWLLQKGREIDEGQVRIGQRCARACQVLSACLSYYGWTFSYISQAFVFFLINGLLLCSVHFLLMCLLFSSWSQLAPSMWRAHTCHVHFKCINSVYYPLSNFVYVFYTFKNFMNLLCPPNSSATAVIARKLFEVYP